MSNLVRRYKMSDGSLLSSCMRLMVGTHRDASTLEQFGWDAARIHLLELGRESFSNMLTDVELSGMMCEATAEKKRIRKQVAEHCAVHILLRAKQNFGDESATYKRFRADELYTSPDHSYWVVLKRIHRQGTFLLSELATEGLTLAHLNTLDGLITDFNNALAAQDAAIDERDRAVCERIEAGNALYAEMVKLGELGKRLWLNVDESKYNEYLLYPHRNGTPEKSDEQVFESEVVAQSVLNLSATGLNGTETITITNTGTTELQVYFSELPTDDPTPSAQLVQAQEVRSVSIAALGFQSAMRNYLNVFNPSLATNGSVLVAIVKDDAGAGKQPMRKRKKRTVSA